MKTKQVFIFIAVIFLAFIGYKIISPKPEAQLGNSKSACIQVCEAIGWDDSKWNAYVSKVNGGMNGIDDMCESFSCRENYPSYTPTEKPTKRETFYGYDCLSDCSGHKAGYDWAEAKGITDSDDCGGNSNSFREGCKAYVEGDINFGNNE